MYAQPCTLYVRNRVLIEPSTWESTHSRIAILGFRIIYYAILFRPPFARACTAVVAFYNEADLSCAFTEVFSEESPLNFVLCTNA